MAAGQDPSAADTCAETPLKERAIDTARPTHFVAVRLVSEEIRRQMASVQRQFANSDARWRACQVPRERLHVPLLLTSLDTQSEGSDHERRARAACAEGASKIREYLCGEKLRLLVNGTGHFRRRVLYASVASDPPELLQAVHYLLARAFLRYGLPVLDEATQRWLAADGEPSPFVAHSSFLKASKGAAHCRAAEKRGFSELLLCDSDLTACAATAFGSQLVGNLELLSTRGMAADGYYPRLQIEPLDRRSNWKWNCPPSTKRRRIGDGDSAEEVDESPEDATNIKAGWAACQKAVDAAWASA
eukprot:TRINITY_DN82275_c0_g1_i1.p1 TRINITY_DN82275_c0_g1~~TRINITY_DN82275_c0_g1_i1.p1  ORF type:complete len:303 (+),score=72.13 TRINITY_DN82275_c0_g1_i1:39-947(+)